MSDDSNSGFIFHSLDNWVGIANLFFIVVVGSAVPLLRWVWKRQEEKRKQAIKDQDERVINQIKEFTDPLEEKVDEVVEVNNEVLKTLNKLTESFSHFSEKYQEDRQKQQAVNNKVDYIDKVFQDNIRFGNRRPYNDQES